MLRIEHRLVQTGARSLSVLCTLCAFRSMPQEIVIQCVLAIPNKRHDK